MKNLKLLLFFFSLSAMLVTASCSKEEANNEKVELGEIKFDRERIGTGQYVTASCQLPKDNSGDKGYEWTSQPILSFTTEIKNGVSYATFFIPYETTGTIEIELNDKYNSLKPAKAEINVEKTDVNNSFWGDNLELTLKNRPELVELETVYCGKMIEYIKNYTGDSYWGYYSFDDNKLVEVSEIRNINNSKEDFWYINKFNLLIRTKLRYYGFTVDKAELINKDGSNEDYQHESTDNNYFTEIASELINNGAEIHIHAHNESTNLLLSALPNTFTSGADKISYISKYTPREKQ